MLIEFENAKGGGTGSFDAFDIIAVLGAVDKQSQTALLGSVVVQTRSGGQLHVKGSVSEITKRVNEVRLQVVQAQAAAKSALVLG